MSDLTYQALIDAYPDNKKFRKNTEYIVKGERIKLPYSLIKYEGINGPILLIVRPRTKTEKKEKYLEGVHGIGRLATTISMDEHIITNLKSLERRRYELFRKVFKNSTKKYKLHFFPQYKTLPEKIQLKEEYANTYIFVGKKLYWIMEDGTPQDCECNEEATINQLLNGVEKNGDILQNLVKYSEGEFDADDVSIDLNPEKLIKFEENITLYNGHINRLSKINNEFAFTRSPSLTAAEFSKVLTRTREAYTTSSGKGKGQIEKHEFVMKRVIGKSLSDIVKQQKGRISLNQLRKNLEIFLSFMEEIKELHNKNIIHRDIKPDNVMVDKSGKATIIDFGFSKTWKDTTKADSALVQIGVPGYMSKKKFEHDQKKIRELISKNHQNNGVDSPEYTNLLEYLDKRLEKYNDATTFDEAKSSDLYAAGTILYDLLGTPSPALHCYTNFNDEIEQELRKLPDLNELRSSVIMEGRDVNHYFLCREYAYDPDGFCEKYLGVKNEKDFFDKQFNNSYNLPLLKRFNKDNRKTFNSIRDDLFDLHRKLTESTDANNAIESAIEKINSIRKNINELQPPPLPKKKKNRGEPEQEIKEIEITKI